MKRPINKWLVASAACFVVAILFLIASRNWLMVGVAIAVQLGILAYEWVDQGTLKGYFRR